MRLTSGTELFSVADLYELSAQVGAAWSDAATRDWQRPAGTLEWSCLQTADHAVDCVYAPAFFLASRRLDRYPDAGDNLMFGERATPERIIESLALAARILAAVVNDASADVEAIMFQGPTPVVGEPRDFPARGALELVLHAHDVCVGLDVPFEPPHELCYRLREHTRPWPIWGLSFETLGRSSS